MITETDLDERATDAADQIRRAVHALPIPQSPVRRRSTVRRVAVAGVALAAVVAAVAVPNLVDDERSDVASAPVTIPRLVPTFVPADIVLSRIDDPPPTPPASVSMFAADSRPGAGALLAQVTHLDNDGIVTGQDCTVRGVSCFYTEALVDNGVTWRTLMWFEGHDAIVLQSTTGDRATMFAAAAEVTVADGTVSNRTLGGLPRIHVGDAARSVNWLLDPTRHALTLAVTASDTSPAPAFMPGRAVDVNGASGWLSHQPSGTDGVQTAVVSWTPAPGVIASATSATLTDDELLQVARSVKPASDEEWNAIPKLCDSFAEGSSCR